MVTLMQVGDKLGKIFEYRKFSQNIVEIIKWRVYNTPNSKRRVKGGYNEKEVEDSNR